jgi:general secretion pathway protein F
VTARFRYRAATGEGEVVEGVVLSPTRQTALDELRRQQLYPVEIHAADAADSLGAERSLNRGDALALWARTLATLLGAGLPLDRALEFTAVHAGHASVARAARDVRSAVQGGATLAGAMRASEDVFGPLASAMVTAGEESGALDLALSRLAAHLEEANEVRSQIRAALLYPALMAVASLVGVIVLLTFVVPRFTRMLQEIGGQLPLSTRLLVGVSHVVTGWWWVWLPAIGVAVAVMRIWLRQPANMTRWHLARLRAPVAGDFERKFATARFARTLGLLLQSGMGILAAMRIARSAISNRAIAEGIERAENEVARGTRVATALEGTLPPLAAQLIAVGDESGQLDALCLRVADTYDGELKRSLRAAIGLIEPAMIITFGVIVGFVALAMLQAIYSVNVRPL